MKQITSITFFLCIAIAGSAQVDYLEYKKRYSLSCGIPDSAEVARNKQLVDSLNGVEISKGVKEYLYDLGWTYYMRYLLYKEEDDIRKAHGSFLKGWKEHEDINALWNLGTTFSQLDDCSRAIEFTELYLENLPEGKTPDYQQVYYRYKFCCEE
jgi:hypothetical protein